MCYCPGIVFFMHSASSTFQKRRNNSQRFSHVIITFMKNALTALLSIAVGCTIYLFASGFNTASYITIALLLVAVPIASYTNSTIGYLFSGLYDLLFTSRKEIHVDENSLEEIMIGPNKRYFYLFIPASLLGLISLGLFILNSIVTGETRFELLLIIVSMLLVVGSFVYLVTTLSMFFTDSVGYCIQLHKKGFTQSAFNKKISLRWQEIESVGEYKNNHDAFITVFLKDTETFVKNSNSLVMKYLLRKSIKVSNAPISISSSGYNVSHKSLLLLMKTYHEKCKNNL